MECDTQEQPTDRPIPFNFFVFLHYDNVVVVVVALTDALNHAKYSNNKNFVVVVSFPFYFHFDSQEMTKN